MDYRRRIERALEFIAANLDQPIRLADVAKAAAFSEHHFHRIFRAIMDETVGEYVTRRRMHTAALMLAYQADLSVTEIGLACGYSSTSNFSKAFSRFFGVSPSEVRNPSSSNKSPALGVLHQRYGHDFSPADLHQIPAPRRADARLAELDAAARFERWQAFTVVCMAGEHGYDLDANLQLWAELIRRVRELELCGEDIDAYAIVYDDPILTSEDRCRYHACVRVAAPVSVPEPLFVATIPAGRYAIFPYRGPGHELGRMYRDIYALWFPHSSLAPGGPPPIEHYVHDEPDEHGNVDMEIAIEVRPMRR